MITDMTCTWWKQYRVRRAAPAHNTNMLCQRTHLSANFTVYIVTMFRSSFGKNGIVYLQINSRQCLTACLPVLIIRYMFNTRVLTLVANVKCVSAYRGPIDIDFRNHYTRSKSAQICSDTWLFMFPKPFSCCHSLFISHVIKFISC